MKAPLRNLTNIPCRYIMFERHFPYLLGRYGKMCDITAEIAAKSGLLKKEEKQRNAYI